jgi:hypothetical protein
MPQVLAFRIENEYRSQEAISSLGLYPADKPFKDKRQWLSLGDHL